MDQYILDYLNVSLNLSPSLVLSVCEQFKTLKKIGDTIVIPERLQVDPHKNLVKRYLGAVAKRSHALSAKAEGK